MCMYIRTYLADLGLIVCLQQLNKMKMLVVAVVASLIVGTIGQVFPTLEQEACFDAFLQDSNRTEETAAINTNCEGIIDIAARTTNVAVGEIVCSLERTNSCFTSLEVLYEACNFDIRAACDVGDCLETIQTGNFQLATAVAANCISVIDLFQPEREAVTADVCRLDPSSPCSESFEAVYQFCNTSSQDVCAAFATTFPTTPSGGSVGLYAVPLFALISALLSIFS